MGRTHGVPMYRRFFFVSVALGLAACSTPQQRCISDATRDLNVVTALIARIEGDLARGYGLADKQVVSTVWRPCHYYRPPMPLPPPPPGTVGQRPPPMPFMGPQMCTDDVVQTIQVPVPIDVQAERRQLEDLRRKQAELSRAAGPAVAQCKAQYPE